MALLDRFLEQAKQPKWITKIRESRLRKLELSRLKPRSYEADALDIFAQIYIAKGHLGYGTTPVGEQIRSELGKSVERRMLTLCKLNTVSQLGMTLLPLLKRLKEPIHWVDLWLILERWEGSAKMGARRLYSTYHWAFPEPPLREVDDEEEEAEERPFELPRLRRTSECFFENEEDIFNVL